MKSSCKRAVLHIWVVSHQGGWSLIRVVFHERVLCEQSFPSSLPDQAIEDGTLDEMEEITKSQKKRAKRKDRDESKDDTPKPKKKRGRPPVEKPAPNPPRTTKMMKKLYNLVVNYKDR